jgi:lipopolysaccharide/colanic/teichoic acid biosynthesis glycosyltransferase
MQYQDSPMTTPAPPVGKRLFDLIVTTSVMPIVLPVIAGLALVVWAVHGSPIFFTQQRPGLYGRPFMLVKFRTMMNACDPEGRPLPDAERLTRFGRFLRSTSLDELPELLNVVRGDMSLVGPRPLLMEYLDEYTPEQHRRHKVLPGITGWVQVNGRNALTWEQKFALDLWYVEHHSLWLDITILFKTVWKVLIRDGINQPGQTTSEFFTRSSKLPSPAVSGSRQNQRGRTGS